MTRGRQSRPRPSSPTRPTTAAAASRGFSQAAGSLRRTSRCASWSSSPTSAIRSTKRELTGGPSWVDSDRFDVVAKAAEEQVVDPDGAPRTTSLTLRTLLANRFKLMAHEENRDRSVYVLMMATARGTLGSKLRKSDVDCSAAMKGPRPALQPGQGPPCSFKTPPGRLFANTFTMPAIASLISRHVDRPIIDRTGLEGRFDIDWKRLRSRRPPTTSRDQAIWRSRRRLGRPSSSPCGSSSD